MKRGLAVVLLLLVATDAGARGRVLSLEGHATAGGKALQLGGELPSPAELVLPAGASLQALLADDLHLALEGPARVSLRADRLHVLEAGALEVSAIEGTLELPGKAKVHLGPKGATVRYRAAALELVWGAATLERPCAQPTSSPTSEPAACTPRQALVKGAPIVLSTSPAAAAAPGARSPARYGSPPRWQPELKITLDDLKSVQQWVAAKQKRQQELAACGCTEGGSSGSSGTDPQQGSISAIERNTTTLYISIQGLPAQVKP